MCVSFFAEEVSKCDTWQDTYAFLPKLLIYPPNPLKAGYAAHSIHRTQLRRLLTAIQVSPRTVSGYAETGRHAHSYGPPRKGGHVIHAVGDCPQTLTPSIRPGLGVRSSDTRNFIDVPFCGFLGPLSAQQN